jgi:hypothetical protein
MYLHIAIIIVLLVIIIFIVNIYSYYESFEITIYDSNEYVYNIGDLLNMQYFCSGWEKNEHVNYKKVATKYTNSILYYYNLSRPDSEDIPNIERLRNATDRYIDMNIDNLTNLINLVSNKNTLTVHVRSGDKGIIEDSYIETINRISTNYDKIVILSGIHSDTNHKNIDESMSALNISLDKIRKINDKEVIINLENADTHLSAMRSSTNLLLHKGGFSALGGLLFQKNNLYLCDFIDGKNKEEYTSYLMGDKILYV